MAATCQQLDAQPGAGVAYTRLGILAADGSVQPNAWPPVFDWQAQTQPTNPPSNCIPCAAMFRRAIWICAGGYKQVYARRGYRVFTRGRPGSTRCGSPMNRCSTTAYTAAAPAQKNTADRRLASWMRDGQYRSPRQPRPARSCAATPTRS